MPKISVLMPIYKTNETYLREAIESILNQTFTDFEFLILDDCPEETREDVVLSYHDKRIKYFKNEANLGITPSRNKLIDLAQGEYLAVMDHDDIAVSNRFEMQVKILDETPEIGVIGGLYIRFPKIKKASKLPEYNNDIEDYLISGCAVFHPSAMIRADVLKKHNIRYEKEFTPAEDYALWARLIGKTKFYNIQKVLMKYRWHETNTSKLQDNKRLESVDKIHQFLKQDQSELWNKVHLNNNYIIRGKLFGCIPVFKMKQVGSCKPKYLKYIPFIKIKMKLEVK